ncbi:MAG: ion transporter, partial [Myxococcota bacterium]
MLLLPYQDQSPPPRPKTPPWKVKLRTFMNHPYTDTTVMVMILISILMIVLEVAVSHASPVLEVLNFVITLFFVFELTLRLLAERKFSLFFRRYWIDIIATAAPYFRFLRA